MASVDGVIEGEGEVVVEVPRKIVAPALRVEELKEEDGVVSTATSDEDATLSVGESSGASDSEAASPKPLPEFEAPDDETAKRIVTQVEFYFSDANILKDAFLLKHVRRNKQGFVSLKLVTSFRKMKAITKDFRVVAYSLRKSEHLEVNVEGTKVRRIAPLPEYDETTPSRTVIAVNLPQENPSIESVSQLLSSCGDVALIRILRPGKSIPADVRKHINKHPELGNTMCAVIEFEHHESAKKACETLTNTEDWRKGLRVALLAPNSKKEKTAKKSQDGKKPPVCPDTDIKKPNEEESRAKSNDLSSDVNKVHSCEEDNWRRRDDDHLEKKRKNARFNKLSPKGDSSGYLSSGSDIEHDTPNRRHSDDGRRGPFPSRASLSPKQDTNLLSPNTTPRTTPKTTPKSSPRSSPRSSPNSRRRNLGKSPLAVESLSPGISPRASPAVSPEMQRRKNSGNIEAANSPSQSPWVQRRLKAQQENSPLAGNSPVASPRLGRRLPDGSLVEGTPAPRMADMEGVVRQPKGPDGTLGFHAGIGRAKPSEEGI